MMKIRIKKCSAFIASALFFLFCVQLAEESLAEQFTLYIESDIERDKYNIQNVTDLHKSYETTLIDELARIGFKVKSSLNKEDVTEHDIILKADFIRLGEKLLIPTAEIKTAKTETILASLKTTAFSLNGEIFTVEKQLDSSAISIARMLYARLLSMNWAEINFEKNTWETEEQMIRLLINGMSGCFKNYFLDTLETEFPGSVSIAVLSETSIGTSKYNFVTSAKTRFITKWVRALLSEQLLIENEHFGLSTRDRFITLQIFPKTIPKGTFCR
jgi:hypothetical protein